MPGEDYEASLRGYIAFDWIDFGRSERLHAAKEFTANVDDWCATDVTTACNRTTARASIPGIGSRLAAPRCKQCCDALGLPHGNGSPKNDAECRRLLGMDT